jgi:ubiquinone/menaquinone biosynthesis C-methylase UbiE
MVQSHPDATASPKLPSNPDAEKIKRDIQDFYAAEAAERASEGWLRSGGAARVPENKASHYFIERKVAAAVALAGLGRDSRVLELGCSWGHMTFLLADRFREVVAVDISAESIELARRRADRYGVRNVEFAQADVESLGHWGDGGFDGAFMFSTLRFCPHPELALAEVYRSLRPGGAAAVDVPNRDCPWYGPLKRVFGIAPHIHDRLYAAGEIRHALQQAGFAEVRSRYLLFTTKRVPDPLLPAFKLLDGVLEGLPGVRRLSGIVMAAGRKPLVRQPPP